MNQPTDIVIHTDAVLADAIRPEGPPRGTTRSVFVTGATGFLGRYLLAELLRETDWNLICLVRAKDADHARDRLLASLKATGRRVGAAAARVSAVPGSLAEPDFGIEQDAFERLAATLDMVIHCAAEVSWLKSYRRLRGSHVVGTLNAIRLACRHHAKPLQFVSTLAVCYALDGPHVVEEATDMAAFVDSMPLGYAQAKCVAESLVRQAAARGLPATIVRPGLICGDSRTGASNHTDLISRLLRGCAMSGVAADVDWGLDCVPVDAVALALCALAARPLEALRVVHLHNRAPRRWRELALWLRLAGYPIRLVGLEQWLQFVDRHAREHAPDLHVLRRFLLARPPCMRGARLIELYLESNRARIRAAASCALLAELGVSLPPLDATLLNRYFARYRATGFMPPSSNARGTLARRSSAEESVRRRVETEATAVEICDQAFAPVMGQGAILSELAALRTDGQAGLWRCKVRPRGVRPVSAPPVDAVLKLRATDQALDEIAIAVAGLCDPELGTAVAAHLPQLAHRGGAGREAALYRDARLAAHMPNAYLAIAPTATEPALLLTEFLAEVDLLDSAERPEVWQHEHLAAAVAGLGAIHAVWYGRHEELARAPWLASTCNSAELPAAKPLWHALARFSATPFSRWFGQDSLPLQRRLVGSLDEWWPAWLAHPRTLIHNDFNPRNLAFRRGAGGPLLCAYDWELAAIGLPQNDLAELLCFVLPRSDAPAAAAPWIEAHRRAIESAAAVRIPHDDWLHGFALALRHLMLCRLPLYAMIDRFKPQTFLPRVVRNWHALMRWADAQPAARWLPPLSRAQ